MHAGLAMVTAASTTSAASGPSLELWVPVTAGAIAAGAAVCAAGFIARRMTGRAVGFSWWLTGSVHAGAAWTAKDSWVTNIAALGAILGTVISDAGYKLTGPEAGVTLLFIVFGGVAVAAPVVYGATAKRESQGVNDTTGSVWGFLLAGAATLFAALGELATLGLLVMAVTDSAATQAAVISALGLGAAAIVVYSVRSLAYFATLPAPRPKPVPADTAPPVSSLIKQPLPPAVKLPPPEGVKLLPPPAPVIRQSLLGNTTFSATL
jgi:hypothetical protein